MSSLVNQVQLVGRLGADAEIKIINKDTKVGSFNLATHEGSKHNGEWKELTLWHHCIVWGDLNKVIAKYGKKGNQLMVVGALNYREYEDSNGTKRNITEIKVNSILVLSTVVNPDDKDPKIINGASEEDLPF